MPLKKISRCPWPGNDPLMIEYHDREWGRPLHDDRGLFEFLILESFQAGLSWRTILHKRENFRKALAGFDAKKISKFNKKKFDSLMKDAGIIRNNLKIKAAINNAKCFLQIQKEFGSFDRYAWSFTKGKTIVNKPKTLKDLPAKTAISDVMSEDMGKRGFKFRGSTICYAFMQAVGIVDDHIIGCKYKRKA
jgi:DNA-3-methyladenine glycosylase I